MIFFKNLTANLVSVKNFFCILSMNLRRTKNLLSYQKASNRVLYRILELG